MNRCANCTHISQYDWNQWICGHEQGPQGEVDPEEGPACEVGSESLFTPLAPGEGNDYTAACR